MQLFGITKLIDTVEIGYAYTGTGGPTTNVVSTAKVSDSTTVTTAITSFTISPSATGTIYFYAKPKLLWGLTSNYLISSSIRVNLPEQYFLDATTMTTTSGYWTGVQNSAIPSATKWDFSSITQNMIVKYSPDAAGDYALMASGATISGEMFASNATQWNGSTPTAPGATFLLLVGNETYLGSTGSTGSNVSARLSPAVEVVVGATKVLSNTTPIVFPLDTTGALTFTSDYSASIDAVYFNGVPLARSGNNFLATPIGPLPAARGLFVDQPSATGANGVVGGLNWTDYAVHVKLKAGADVKISNFEKLPTWSGVSMPDSDGASLNARWRVGANARLPRFGAFNAYVDTFGGDINAFVDSTREYVAKFGVSMYEPKAVAATLAAAYGMKVDVSLAVAFYKKCGMIANPETTVVVSSTAYPSPATFNARALPTYSDTSLVPTALYSLPWPWRGYNISPMPSGFFSDTVTGLCAIGNNEANMPSVTIKQSVSGQPYLRIDPTGKAWQLGDVPDTFGTDVWFNGAKFGADMLARMAISAAAIKYTAISWVGCAFHNTQCFASSRPQSFIWNGFYCTPSNGTANPAVLNGLTGTLVVWDFQQAGGIVWQDTTKYVKNGLGLPNNVIAWTALAGTDPTDRETMHIFTLRIDNTVNGTASPRLITQGNANDWVSLYQNGTKLARANTIIDSTLYAEAAPAGAGNLALPNALLTSASNGTGVFTTTKGAPHANAMTTVGSGAVWSFAENSVSTKADAPFTDAEVQAIAVKLGGKWGVVPLISLPDGQSTGNFLELYVTGVTGNVEITRIGFFASAEAALIGTADVASGLLAFNAGDWAFANTPVRSTAQRGAFVFTSGAGETGKLEAGTAYSAVGVPATVPSGAFLRMTAKFTGTSANAEKVRMYLKLVHAGVVTWYGLGFSYDGNTKNTATDPVFYGKSGELLAGSGVFRLVKSSVDLSTTAWTDVGAGLNPYIWSVDSAKTYAFDAMTMTTTNKYFTGVIDGVAGLLKWPFSSFTPNMVQLCNPDMAGDYALLPSGKSTSPMFRITNASADGWTGTKPKVPALWVLYIGSQTSAGKNVTLIPTIKSSVTSGGNFAIWPPGNWSPTVTSLGKNGIDEMYVNGIPLTKNIITSSGFEDTIIGPLPQANGLFYSGNDASGRVNGFTGGLTYQMTAIHMKLTSMTEVTIDGFTIPPADGLDGAVGSNYDDEELKSIGLRTRYGTFSRMPRFGTLRAYGDKFANMDAFVASTKSLVASYGVSMYEPSAVAATLATAYGMHTDVSRAVAFYQECNSGFLMRDADLNAGISNVSMNTTRLSATDYFNARSLPVYIPTALKMTALICLPWPWRGYIEDSLGFLNPFCGFFYDPVTGLPAIGHNAVWNTSKLQIKTSVSGLSYIYMNYDRWATSWMIGGIPDQSFMSSTAYFNGASITPEVSARLTAAAALIKYTTVSWVGCVFNNVKCFTSNYGQSFVWNGFYCTPTNQYSPAILNGITGTYIIWDLSEAFPLASRTMGNAIVNTGSVAIKNVLAWIPLEGTDLTDRDKLHVFTLRIDNTVKGTNLAGNPAKIDNTNVDDWVALYQNGTRLTRANTIVSSTLYAANPPAGAGNLALPNALLTSAVNGTSIFVNKNGAPHANASATVDLTWAGGEAAWSFAENSVNTKSDAPFTDAEVVQIAHKLCTKWGIVPEMSLAVGQTGNFLELYVTGVTGKVEITRIGFFTNIGGFVSSARRGTNELSAGKLGFIEVGTNWDFSNGPIRSPTSKGVLSFTGTNGTSALVASPGYSGGNVPATVPGGPFLRMTAKFTGTAENATKVRMHLKLVHNGIETWYALGYSYSVYNWNTAMCPCFDSTGKLVTLNDSGVFTLLRAVSGSTYPNWTGGWAWTSVGVARGLGVPTIAFTTTYKKTMMTNVGVWDGGQFNKRLLSWRQSGITLSPTVEMVPAVQASNPGGTYDQVMVTTGVFGAYNPVQHASITTIHPCCMSTTESISFGGSEEDFNLEYTMYITTWPFFGYFNNTGWVIGGYSMKRDGTGTAGQLSIMGRYTPNATGYTYGYQDPATGAPRTFLFRPASRGVDQTGAPLNIQRPEFWIVTKRPGFQGAEVYTDTGTNNSSVIGSETDAYNLRTAKSSPPCISSYWRLGDGAPWTSFGGSSTRGTEIGGFVVYPKYHDAGMRTMVRAQLVSEFFFGTGPWW
jgi:hypothetical protein